MLTVKKMTFKLKKNDFGNRDERPFLRSFLVLCGINNGGNSQGSKWLRNRQSDEFHHRDDPKSFFLARKVIFLTVRVYKGEK